MKLVIRLVAIAFLLIGGIALIKLLIDNQELGEEIAQLESELGRMSIADSDRVYLVEIETPDVPPEVAQHLDRVWQFRCYMPPGYDVMRFCGGGRVASDGVYFNGGYSSGWGTPSTEAVHELLTISFQEREDRLDVFYAFGGSSGTTTWGRLKPDQINDSLVVQKIVNSAQGPRSFDQDTILPLLKIYDPNSAQDENVAGKIVTTYSGGMFVVCPKSRESEFDQLKRGEMLYESESPRVAKAVTND